MSNYKRKEVMDYLTRKPVTAQDYQAAIDINNLRPRAPIPVSSGEGPETDYQTEVAPEMVVPPQDVLPKGAEPVMPFAPGIPNPQDRILELATGGRVNFNEGSKLTGTDKTLEQNIRQDHKAYNDYRKSIGQPTIPLDNAFIKMWQRTRLNSGGRAEFKKGSDLGNYIYVRQLPNGEIRYRVAFEGKEKIFKDKNEAFKYRDNLVSEKSASVQKELGDKKFISNEDFKKLFIEKKLSDKDFANFLNEQGYVTDKKGLFTDSGVNSRRIRNDIPSFVQEQRIQNVSEEGILKRAEDIDAFNPNTGKVEKGELLRQYKAGVIPDLDTLLNKVQQREGTSSRTQRKKEDPEFRKIMSDRQKKSMEKMRSTPEGLERLREIQRKYRAKVATEVGAPPPPKNNKERFWLDLYQTAFRAEKRGIDSAIKFADYAPEKYPSMNIVKGTTLIDSKTGEKLTFKNLEDFINTNKPGGMDYDKILNEYEKKVFFQKNQDLKDFFGEKMSSNYERGLRYNPANIHHPFGRFNNPYNVQFTFFPENKKEASLKKVFDTEFNQAETLSDKKKIFKNYINQLEGLGIESGFNQKLYGERPTLEEQMTREGYDVSKDPRAEEIRKLKFEALEPNSPLRKAVGYFPGSAVPLTLFDAITLPLAGYSIPETAAIASQNLLKNPYIAGAANIATQMYDIQKGGGEEMISKANERRGELEQGITNIKENVSNFFNTKQEEIPSYSEFQFNKGGRVHLKNGTDDGYFQEIPSLGLSDPIEILEQQMANEKDPIKVLALDYKLEQIKKKQSEEKKLTEEYKMSQKEKGVKYMEDFPSQTDYLLETGKQLFTNPKYFYGKLGKGVVEGTEWLVGQPLQTLFSQTGKNFEFYEPVGGEKLGINKFIEENIPKDATTGTLLAGDVAEIAGSIADPFLAYGLVKGAVKGAKPKPPTSTAEDTVDPMRRDILKTSAVMGTGAALYPIAKNINILEDLGKVVPKKAPLVKIIKPLGITETKFPEWFPSLINRLRKEGNQKPIYATKEIPLTKEEYLKLREEKVPRIYDRYLGRTQNYVDELKQKGIPQHYQIKDTDEIIGYEYVDKNLPNVKAVEYNGEEMNVYFENNWGRTVEVNYTAPGKKNKEGQFAVSDARPEPSSGPEDVPDFEQVYVTDIDEVYGGSGKVEQYATKSKKPRYTKGAEAFDDNELRALAEYDRMRDEGLFDE